MKKHGLRLDAIVLTAAMVMGTFVFSPNKNVVLADGEIDCTTETAIKEAVENAQPGETVKIRVTSGIPLQQSIEVDDGKTLVLEVLGALFTMSDANIIHLEEGSNLVYSGGTVQVGNAAMVYGEGDNDIEILGGDITTKGCIVSYSGNLVIDGNPVFHLDSGATGVIEMRGDGDTLCLKGGSFDYSHIGDISSSSQEVYGVVHMLKKGLITIEGGVFTGCKTNMGGALVHADDGAIVVSGANKLTIKENSDYSLIGGGAFYLGNGASLEVNSPIDANTNTASANGGFVYVSEGASCIINDSSLTLNGANSGGAIYSEGTLELSNVQIMNNTASLNSAGVFASGGVAVSGKVIIKDNKCTTTSQRSNLYLPNGEGDTKALISVVDVLTEAEIGVTVDDLPETQDTSSVITSGLKDSNSSYQVFFSDVEKNEEELEYAVKEENNEAAIVLIGEPQHDYTPSWSLTIGGEVKLICKVFIPDDSLNENTYVTFNFVDSSSENKTVKCNSNMIPDDDGKYTFVGPSVRIPELADEIVVTLHLDNGTEIPLQSSYNKNITVADVAKAIMGPYMNNEREKYEYLKALLIFGGYAQSYFGHNTTNLAYSNVQYSINNLSPMEYDESFGDRSITKPDGCEETNLTYFASTVLMWTNVSIRHYFFVNDGKIENYVFYYGDTELTPKLAPGTQRYYYVDFGSIDATNYPTQYEMTVKLKSTGAEVLTVKYSVMNYLMRKASLENGDALYALVRSAYNFYVKTKDLSSQA
ncbi:MAG: hypothetical protein IKG93_00450 [Clostridiales bacterium]|nr:hypothetical protein [Clostridiales bacterium]